MDLIILAVPLLLLWFMFNRSRKQQRQMMARQDAVRPGAQVMTTSGMYAEVVAVEDAAFVLEIAPGVHTRWNRRAIGEVLDPGPLQNGDVDDENIYGGNVGGGAVGGEPVVDVRDDVRAETRYPPLPENDPNGSTGTDGR